MNFLDNIGTLIDAVLVITIVTGACLMDLFRNPLGHPKKLVRRRFANWFLVGITYASTYFGRYNMNVVNQARTHKDLGVSASEFGIVLTVGSASYAVFVVINGFMVDKIGGARAMVIGALGSGFFNLVQGLFVHFAVIDTDNPLQGTTSLIIMCVIFACNNFFQTFCTSAICKVAVNWYNIKERGYFSGVFGVIISLGFFFAYQVNGVVYDNMKWSWVYFIPCIQLTIFGILNWIWAVDTPADAGFTYDPITQTDSAGQPSESTALLGGSASEGKVKPKKKGPSLKTLFMTVFGNPIFIILCMIDICLGWNRDGVLGWFPEVLSARFGCSSSSNQFALASGGTTIAGMFGSLGAGMLSDSLFHSRRPPVAMLFYIGLFINVTILLFIPSGWAFAFLIALCSVWLNGLNGLITSTCAMDFAGSDATATAVGLLDGIQKIGSSASGFMGGILSPVKGEYSGRDYITAYNYQNWVYSFLPPACFAVCLCVFILDRKAATKPAPAPKSQDDTCVAVQTNSESINVAPDDHQDN